MWECVPYGGRWTWLIVKQDETGVPANDDFHPGWLRGYRTSPGMNLLLVLGFRMRRDTVLRLLPQALSSIAAAVRDDEYGEGSSARVTVSAEELELLLAWGAEPYHGKSMVTLARAHARYEAKELSGLDFVEVFRPAGGPSILHVRNFRPAYRGTWSWGYFGRVQWQQFADLDKKPRRGYDFQLTLSQEWVVSRRAGEVLTRFGVQLRPLRLPSHGRSLHRRGSDDGVCCRARVGLALSSARVAPPARADRAWAPGASRARVAVSGSACDLHDVAGRSPHRRGGGPGRARADRTPPPPLRREDWYG
jgi:hypothetical protein